MNFKVWIEKLENANVRDALRLRMERKFPEAMAKLNLACEEGDGKAMYFKARAYWFGGWGVHRDTNFARKVLELCRKAKCPWLMGKEGDVYGKGCYYNNHNAPGNRAENKERARMYFQEAHNNGHPLAAIRLYYCRFLGRVAERKLLATVIHFGDEQTQQVYALLCMVVRPKTSRKWLIRSAKANHERSIVRMAENHYDLCNILLCAKYLIKLRERSYMLTNRLLHNIPEIDPWIRLRELFMYGRAFHKFPGKFDETTDQSALPLRIFNESTTRAKAAALYFIGICQKYGLLSKDMRRMIGEMIWKSRYDPDAWGITL
jgi:TPR repeat protein